MYSPIRTSGVTPLKSRGRRVLRSTRVHDDCPGCGRSPSARAYDRFRLATLPATATIACFTCNIVMPAPGTMQAARLAPVSPEFRIPLHLVTYEGSGSMFRGGSR